MQKILLILLCLACSPAALPAQGAAVLGHPVGLPFLRLGISVHVPVDSSFALAVRAWTNPRLNIGLGEDVYVGVSMAEVLGKAYLYGDSRTTGAYFASGLYYIRSAEYSLSGASDIIAVPMRAGFQHTFKDKFLMDVQLGANIAVSTPYGLLRWIYIQQVSPAAVVGAGIWLSRF